MIDLETVPTDELVKELMGRYRDCGGAIFAAKAIHHDGPCGTVSYAGDHTILLGLIEESRGLIWGAITA